MKNTFASFKLSLQLIKKDKVALGFALIPILIGITLYAVLGTFFFGGMTDYGQKLLEQYVSNESMGKAIGYILSALIAVMMYFIINWTFVLFVSIIASPFNDMLSSRLEKQILGKDLPSFGEAFSNSFSNFFATIFNEVKKVSFILGLSVLAFVISFIPFLAPVSLIIGALVIASEFLDFSWSRHGLPLNECKASLKQNLVGYIFGGIFFMMLISIPFLGLLVPSWGTSYFTVLWVKNNEHSHQITQ